jgi:hypothetical protein
MKKPIFFVISFLMLLALACGFNVSTANIQDAKMAKDEAASQPATTFGQNDVIYLVANLANASDDTKIKAVWTAVEAEGVDPNYVIGEKELTSGSGPVNFSLSPNQPWPAGKYKVDLYLNGELKQTLDFAVEADEAAQVPTPTTEPTQEPTATPAPTETPEPTATEEPTATTVSSSGDTLAASTEEATTEATAEGEGTEEATTEEEATPEATALPLKDEPYVHPSGAFTFAVPEAWEVASEDETSATLGTDEAAVGAVFVDMGMELSDKQMQDFMDTFVEKFVSAFGKDYKIIEQKVQPDDSIYVALSYTGDDGAGDIDFFFEQRQTVVFVLYFATTKYNELQPTWDAIIDSYSVDPEAALAAAPAATPTEAAPVAKPTPVPPTATPAPAVDPLAPQAGRSRLWVFNEFGQEVIFTINNQQHTIPTGGFDNMTPIDLDAGRYTYTVSLPGGGASNGEVTMAPNEAWAVGVRGDSAVYNPFKVYPQ